MISDTVSTVKRIVKEGVLRVITPENTFSSKYVIVASGVNDIFPGIDNLSEFLGKTFFTCIDCNGYEMKDKNSIIIGNGNGVARTALAVKQGYTDKITICTGKENRISSEYLEKLKKEGIKVINKNIKHINGKNGAIRSVVLNDDSVLECDCVLSDLGCVRNDSFLQGLDLRKSREGYVEVDSHYESSLKNLFVIGPLNTGPDQVSVAVGEGAVAAMHIIESELNVQ